MGVLFTEIGADDRESIVGTMMSRVSETLRNNLSLEKFSQVGISMHVFPETWDQEGTHGNPTLYPDFVNRNQAQKFSRIAKRGMDIVGSAAALIVLSPVFLVVAALVKLSSKGPVLFRQERLGQLGKPFTFLKFRSMFANNDRKIHQEFMKRVIQGNHDGRAEGGKKPVYKMTNDPRITKIGSILRRTSLDELPQLSMCCGGRCRWWGRGRRSPTSAVSTTFGIAAACSRSSPESPACGRSRDAAASVLTTWYVWTCSTCVPGLCGWTFKS